MCICTPEAEYQIARSSNEVWLLSRNKMSFSRGEVALVSLHLPLSRSTTREINEPRTRTRSSYCWLLSLYATLHKCRADDPYLHSQRWERLSSARGVKSTWSKRRDKDILYRNSPCLPFCPEDDFVHPVCFPLQSSASFYPAPAIRGSRNSGSAWWLRPARGSLWTGRPSVCFCEKNAPCARLISVPVQMVI